MFDDISAVRYAGGSGDIAGYMRKWEPIRFGDKIDCNRVDLWEDFEKSAPKFFNSKVGIFAGVLALGATALLLHNKFNNNLNKEA